MSYEIEYRRWVLKTGPIGQYDDNFYFGFSEIGSSNVVDHHGKRVRKIIPLLAELDYEFMINVVTISRACETGMLKLLGRDTKPENFISNWRKEQVQAKNLKDYLESGLVLTVSINEMQRKLERKAKNLMEGGSYEKKRAHEINNCLLEFDHCEFVEEEQKYFRNTTRQTVFKFTKNRHTEVMELFSRAYDHLGEEWHPYSTNFSDYAYDRC